MPYTHLKTSSQFCTVTEGIKPYDIQMYIVAQMFHVYFLILLDIFPREWLWHMEANSFLEEEVKVSEQKCVQNRRSVGFF